jgi:hypothetical protein
MRRRAEGALGSATAWRAASWIDFVSSALGSTPMLVAGLILTTATQVRLTFAPVGAGEMALTAWIAGRVSLLSRAQHSTSSQVPVFKWFWIVTCPLLAMGYWNASRRGVVAAAVVHDTFAYLFVICFVAVLTRGPQVRERMHAAAFAFSIALPLSLGLVLAGAWIWPLFGGLCFSEDPVPRFRALATNPNQVVFALVTTPFLLLKSLNDRAKTRLRPLYIIALVTALTVGLAIRSDSLLISWAFVGIALSLSVFRRSLRPGRWRLETDPWNAGGAFVSAVALIGLALSVPGAHSQRRQPESPKPTPVDAMKTTTEAVPLARLPRVIENRFVGKYGQHDAGGRVLYWRTSFAAIQESPVVGYGPGAHAGTTAPHQDMEAHNVALDWYLGTGLFGELSLLALAAYLYVRAFRPLQETKASMWLALAVIGMLHFYLRQPVIWFLLVFIAL